MSEVYSGAIDRGLEGVVACTTGISSIVDTTLCYRGYTIEDLAEHSCFEEVVFLLWNDRLPTEQELHEFKLSLTSCQSLNEEYINLLRKVPTAHVHPMAWLRTATSLMGLWDADAEDSSEAANKRKACNLTAKLGPLVATFVRLRNGESPIAPREGQSLAWNFLYCLKGEEPDLEMVRIFDTCLILHADHELNCSAFAARVTSSSLSDVYSAVVSAIAALKGPLHGGANEQVMRMLRDNVKEERHAPQWIKEALERKEKIMGFGHRVYRNGDPRAKILRKMSESLCTKAGKPWYNISKVIDETVQSEKGLLPNVDFYSASVYYCMGIPLDVFTPIFAVSRVSGWLAHIFEQYSNNRIYRPRGQWRGHQGLIWKPFSERSS